MSENTKIEWCDHTFNPWEGCQHAGPGCDGCYAEARNARFGGGTAPNWGPGAPRRRTSAANWNKPSAWNSLKFYQCTCCGWRGSEKDKEFRTPRNGCIHDLVPSRARVFCASLADVFDNAVDPQWRTDLFRLIESTPNLDWLLLTKRIGNVRSLSQAAMGMIGIIHKPLPQNAWIGATIVNQAEAERDIPKLLAVPARVRFLSMEPLLGSVNLRSLEVVDGELDALKADTWEQEIDRWRDTDKDWIEQFEDWYDVNLSDGLTGPMHATIDWVIVGGESGPGARAMHPDWARSLRDQCETAGVPFLFKQWGEWKPICQMEEAEHGGLYKSNVTAKPHEDQGNLDDCYGRRCTVPYTVQHSDGSLHDITEPMAFGQGSGAMQIFRVGKKAAGRLLDGRTRDGFPS